MIAAKVDLHLKGFLNRVTEFIASFPNKGQP